MRAVTTAPGVRSKRPERHVAAIERAATVLETLTWSPRGCGVTEIATCLHVAKSSAHRLLITLEALGYVEQQPNTAKYKLTLKMFQQGARFVRVSGFGPHIGALLEGLRLEVGVVARMAMRLDDYAVWIYRLDSQAVSLANVAVDERVPLYCSAVGKALLSGLMPSEFNAYLQRVDLRRFTDSTITVAAALRADVDASRTRGYALDRGEHVSNTWCVAAPVYDLLGRVVAAVSICAPAARLHAYGITEGGKRVICVSEQLTSALTAASILDAEAPGRFHGPALENETDPPAMPPFP